MTPGAIADEFRSVRQDLRSPTAIQGVKVHRLTRLVDDRGFFQEIYRAKADHPGGDGLAEFFRDVPVAQINFTIVNAENHVKGLHYHLKQQDVWFCPHPSKAKFVLFDVRKDSPTSGATQVVVAGRRARRPRAHPGGRRARLSAAHEPVRALLHRDAHIRREGPRRMAHRVGPPGREGSLGVPNG